MVAREEALATVIGAVAGVYIVLAILKRGWGTEVTTLREVADSYLAMALHRVRRANRSASLDERLTQLDLAVTHFEHLDEFISETGVLPGKWQRAVDKG